MSKMLWWTESVGRVFSYLQQDSTSSWQQWSDCLTPQWITLHPYQTPQILAWAEMLANSWVVLHIHSLWCRGCDGLRVLTGWSQTYNKPLPTLGKYGLPSFNLNGSLSTPIRLLRFLLELKCWPIPVWFYLLIGLVRHSELILTYTKSAITTSKICF